MADDIETVLERTNDEDAQVIADFIAEEITKQAEETLQDIVTSILLTLGVKEARVSRELVDDTQLKLATGQLVLEQEAVSDDAFRFTVKENEVSDSDIVLNLLRALG